VARKDSLGGAVGPEETNLGSAGPEVADTIPEKKQPWETSLGREGKNDDKRGETQ
jgi:hypothetical protein